MLAACILDTWMAQASIRVVTLAQAAHVAKQSHFFGSSDKKRTWGRKTNRTDRERGGLDSSHAQRERGREIDREKRGTDTDRQTRRHA